VGSGYRIRFSATSNTPADSWTFSILQAGQVIPPSTPPASQVSFNVDSTQDSHPISRFVYGMNGWDPAQRPRNLALSRSGGNRMTAYNWETNASNAGADFHNQNDNFLGGGEVPNGAVAPGLEAARAAGAGMIVTMPLIGYVSADKLGNGDVANSGANYLQTRFFQSPARKNAAFSLVPNTTDAFVYQDEYINFLDKTYPGAFAAASNPIMISLDNEPDLWQSTHARLRGDGNPNTQAGTTATYAEMVQRTIDYADAAKDVNPDALIFGPVNYGWQGMVRFQDAADANNRDFLEFYLAQMAAAESPNGHRLVDVLDVHWYPEAQGAGVRITEENTTPAWSPHASRRRAASGIPRHTENSWIAQFSTNGPSACCRASRTRSRLTTLARGWPSPSTTTAPPTTSRAPSRRPTCSASSAARGCSRPTCGAWRRTTASCTARSRSIATTTAPTAASATPASAPPTATSSTPRYTPASTPARRAAW
jgi:hypothetical protein